MNWSVSGRFWRVERHFAADRSALVTDDPPVYASSFFFASFDSLADAYEHLARLVATGMYFDLVLKME